MREIVPVEIKGGPLYEIEFRANLTQPELSMSSDNLDFGKVCVQTRKTRKIRFENNKEVPCRWHYNAKGDLSTGADVEQRFNITPLSGTLMPGQKQTVDVMFTPSTAGPVNQKMLFRCDDN
jgi:P pilus assembly chaperone PapD